MSDDRDICFIYENESAKRPCAVTMTYAKYLEISDPAFLDARARNSKESAEFIIQNYRDKALFPAKLKAFRKSKGLTQKELSELLSIHYTRFSMIENSEGTFNNRELERIRNILINAGGS